MTNRIAIIDKCPNNNKYEKYFKFEYDHFHLSSLKLTKVLKKDVDIQINLDDYQYIVLVGSEATKEYTKGTSVLEMSGHLVDEKFLIISNPAVLIFKPEGLPEFNKALDKLNDIVLNGAPVITKIDWAGIQTTSEAHAWVDAMIAAKPSLVVWDTETTALDPREGYVLGLSLCYKDKHACYISSDAVDDLLVQKLQQIINTTKTVFHNSKFDMKMLSYHFNFVFNEENTHDTILMHYLLDERAGTHGLKLLALKYTEYGDYDKALEIFKEQFIKSNNITKDAFNYSFIPFHVISEYAAIDVCVTYELYYKFYPLIAQNPKLLNVYNLLMIPGIFLLSDIEMHGIPFSIEHLEFARVYLDKRIQDARNKLYEFKELKDFEEIQGSVFNPNSVPQLRSLLFDYLNLPCIKTTAKGVDESTDSSVLEELSALHPIPAQIIILRKAIKLKSTYVDKILEGIHLDGRVRTNFNLIFTTSGRLSSSGKFNGQTIPRDDPLIKGCIVAEPGYKIITQDLATAEVYGAAVLSQDKNLMAAFVAGEDFHSYVAHTMFNLKAKISEVKQLFPIYRQAAKAITFGILFGSGAAKVAETVNKEGGNLSKEEAQEFIDLYFGKFPQLKRYLDTNKELIKKNGFLYSFFGRKRRLINVHSPDKSIASHEVRSGINFLIQSVASDVNLLAAVEARKEYIRLGLRATIFALIHDAILVHVHEDDAEQAAQILKVCTKKDRGCSIPTFPIGTDTSIVNDYSEGKFEKTYGEKFKEFNLSRISSGVS